MEQEKYGENTDNHLDSKSEIVSYDVKAESASPQALTQCNELVVGKDLANNFATPTPERTIQSSCNKRRTTVKAVRLFSNDYQNEGADTKDKSVGLPDGITGRDEVQISDATTEVGNVQLPDKYKSLAELFDRIDTSIRVLNLRKKLPTFQNICTVVEAMTQRMLSHSHLAQMKYVLPEAIHVEKILTHDKKTLCMVPDMKITLLLDAVEHYSCQSASMALRNVFHQRLLNYYNKHPESCEIPEAVLPEPFNQRNHTVLRRPLSVNSSVEPPGACSVSEPVLVSSSFGQSIRKSFSQKILVPETEKTQLLASLTPANFADETDSNTQIPPQKECGAPSNTTCTTSPASQKFSSECSNSAASESPSMKLPSRSLTVETPVQPTPAKRIEPLTSCVKLKTETEMSSHMVAKRSLNFEESSEDMDISLQTSAPKDILEEDNVIAPVTLTELVQEYKNEMMNQTGPVNRQQMLSSLLGLINTIQNIFKSANGSLITKQELLQKIIADNLDIVDTREVEEQLELLEELVPDWIFQKLVPSGDLMYSIRKVSDMELVRARLSAAV